MSARLFVLSGADLGRSFQLDEGSTIGRNTDCAVVLRDGSISRVHARVERRESGLVLVDRESRNGLWNKGVRAAEVALTDLGEFKIGDVLVRVRLEEHASTSAPEVEFDVVPKAPPPKPAARAALELEEIVLEDGPPIAPPIASKPAPARTSEPVRPAASAPSLGATRMVPGAGAPLEARGQRVLQYYKTDARAGVLSSDLDQRPWWFKLVAVLVALALCAGIGWLAFAATSFLRDRAQGDTVEDVEPH
ncbi:MAG: FHA domain-containing protein [Planctomycetes bacterium]|nr:FHA domain-containing protein [Planctomycetota bacterium]